MTTTDYTDRIHRAVLCTLRKAPGYWRKLLSEHAELSGEAAGSGDDDATVAELEEKILGATWTEYFDWSFRPKPSNLGERKVFTAPLPGRLKFVRLDTLDPNRLVTLRDFGGIPREMVVVAEGCRGQEVEFSILGIEGPPNFMVSQFYAGHMGKMVGRFRSSSHMNRKPGTRWTVLQAISFMGLDWAYVE